MNEMTLSSRHRIRNSSPGGLRPSTLPVGHGGSPQYWVLHVDGEETFLARLLILIKKGGLLQLKFGVVGVGVGVGVSVGVGVNIYLWAR